MDSDVLGTLMTPVPLGLYAQATHPSVTPATSGRPSTWALYALSTISVVHFSWAYAFRRCCKRNDSRSVGNPGGYEGGEIPIWSSRHFGDQPERERKRGWFGRKRAGEGKERGSQQPVTFNLLLDASALASLTGKSPRPPARYPYSPTSDLGSLKLARSSSAPLHDQDAVKEDEEGNFDLQELLQLDDSDGAREVQEAIDAMDPLARRQLRHRLESARRDCKKQSVVDACLGTLWLCTTVWALFSGGSCSPGSGEGW